MSFRKSIYTTLDERCSDIEMTVPYGLADTFPEGHEELKKWIWSKASIKSKSHNECWH